MQIKDGVRRQSNIREKKSCESKWDLFVSVNTISQNNQLLSPKAQGAGIVFVAYRANLKTICTILQSPSM